MSIGKKILSYILVIVLVVSISQCALADAIPMTCEFANSINWTSDAWFSSAENRAFLTILFLFEMGANKTISIDDYSAGESLVCRKGDVLSIAICGDYHTLMIFYEPNIKYASYLYMDKYELANLYRSLNSIYEEAHINTSSALEEALSLLRSTYNLH